MEHVFPIFFSVLKSMGVSNPTQGKKSLYYLIFINIIYIDLFTPFVIFIGFGFFLGFITSYMIFKINKLELENKILEKRILEERNKNKEKEPIKEEQKKENEKKEENIKNEIDNKEKEEKNEIENKEKEDLNTVDKIIKEEPKKPSFKPPEIKEKKVEEEAWTVVKKKDKKKKPH